MRHLPTYGWSPTLLTAQARAYGDDPGPSDSVSYMSIRAGAIEARMPPVQRLVSAVKTSGAPSAQSGRPVRRPSRRARIAALVATPDRLAAWIPFAVVSGLREARRSEVIFAAGPPFTNHVVGMILSRLTRRPLVVAVDDPWVSMPHRTWYGRLQRGIQIWLERASMARAERVLVATEGFGTDIRDRIPLAAGKLHVVYYGFDADSVAIEIDADPAPPLRLVYAGSLRGSQYEATALIEALVRLQDGDPHLRDRLHLDVYGALEQDYEDLFRRKLESIVTLHGFRPHREVSEAIRRAHTAILLINDAHPEFGWYTSAKLFAYAGARRPILALVPSGGDAARLIEERKLGVVVPPRDPAAIVAAIGMLEREHVRLTHDLGDVGDLTSEAAAGEAARAFDLAAAR